MLETNKKILHEEVAEVYGQLLIDRIKKLPKEKQVESINIVIRMLEDEKEKANTT